MKHFLVFIATLLLLYGCSTATKVVSPEDVSKEVISKFPNVEMVYSLPPTETEYVYILSTKNGFIIALYIEKKPPHKITKSGILFRCVCDEPKRRTDNGTKTGI